MSHTHHQIFIKGESSIQRGLCLVWLQVSWQWAVLHRPCRSLCVPAAPDLCMSACAVPPAAAAGTDMRLANYLLLALAAFQFPFSFLLAYRPM
jgi:hypothetical protein